jgi:hypothetical protein
MSEILVYVVIFYFIPLITAWGLIVHDVRTIDYKPNWQDIRYVVLPILNILVFIFAIFIVFIPYLCELVGLKSKFIGLKGKTKKYIANVPNKLFLVKKG